MKISPEQWARNVLTNHDRYCILDTETTGLYNAQPVQLALIDLYGNALINTLIKPTIPITDGAIKVHHITEDKVKDAPSFLDIYSELFIAIGDRTLLIYNSTYDIEILQNSCNAYGLYLPKFKTDCVMLQYSEFIGDWNDYHGNYKWQKLPAGDHSAYGDCVATLKVIKVMSDSNE
jgi:DNA polymerase III subunit epsilon